MRFLGSVVSVSSGPSYIGSIPSYDYIDSAPKVLGGIIACVDTQWKYIYTGGEWTKFAFDTEFPTSNKKYKVCATCGNPSAILNHKCNYCRNYVYEN